MMGVYFNKYKFSSLELFLMMSPKVKLSREHTRVKIQTLAKEGYNLKQISERCEVSTKTVKKWKNMNTVLDKRRSGRPKKLSSVDKRQIKQKMYRKMGSSLRKTTKMINSAKRNIAENKKVCYNTVKNYLKTTNWGQNAFKSTTRPKLSKKNIEDRFNFGSAVEKSGYLTSGPRGNKLRSNILFTDESWIEIDAPLNSQNNRFRTENRSDVPPTERLKFPNKVMVAGGFCAGGVSKLHFIEEKETVNANYYQEKILPLYFEATETSIMSSKNNITFQQDGAGPHRADSTMKILNTRFTTVWGKDMWPGNSPDLNPIENLWSILKDSVYEEPRPRTKEELRTCLENKWNSLSVDVLQKLSSSFKTRIEEMMANGGGHTRY